MRDHAEDDGVNNKCKNFNGIVSTAGIRSISERKSLEHLRAKHGNGDGPQASTVSTDAMLVGHEGRLCQHRGAISMYPESSGKSDAVRTPVVP